MSEYDNLYNRYTQEATEYASSYGIDPKTKQNGPWDAFRHAYASGAMTREYSKTAAHVFGDLNEIYGDFIHNQKEAAKNMDEWNNAVGRDIGKNATSSDEIARRVYEAMQRGDLITDPANDTRRYDGSNPPGEGNNGRAGGGADAGADGMTSSTSHLPETDLNPLVSFPVESEVPPDNHHAPLTEVTPEPEDSPQIDNNSGLPVEDERERQQIAVAPRVPNINGDDTQLTDWFGNTYTLYYAYCKGRFTIGSREESGHLLEMWYHDQDGNNFGRMAEVFWPSNSESRFILFIISSRDNLRSDDGVCNSYFCKKDSCDEGQYNGNRQNPINRLIKPLDEAWNGLKIWLKDPDYYDQSQINGTNADSVDSVVQEELNSFGEANMQAASGEATPNKPHNDNLLLYPDTFIHDDQNPHCCDAPSEDDSQNDMVDFRNEAWNELKVWLSASAPVSPLAESIVAFTPPAADGQMRFSSDYHTAMTPLMAAGWQ